MKVLGDTTELAAYMGVHTIWSVTVWSDVFHQALVRRTPVEWVQASCLIALQSGGWISPWHLEMTLGVHPYLQLEDGGVRDMLKRINERIRHESIR